jgi:DNA-binding transcriptional LysR family regulator
MELRHLRYFTAVAKELHFGRAAKQLNIAQPPLSQQIQNLEAELGVALFDRSSRPIKLTEAGRALRGRARNILDEADHAAEEARRIGQGQIGRLVIGFMSTATLTHLPLVLRTFRTDYPDVDIALVQMTSGEQLDEIAAGRIDIGFISLNPDTQPVIANGVELVLETAWRETLAAALPPTHRLAERSKVALGELAKETFIGLPRHQHTAYFDQVIDLCLGAGFSPQIHQQVSQLPAALALIAANCGIGLMPRSLSRAWTPLVAFVPLREGSQIAVNTIQRRDNRSPVLEAFLGSLRGTTR